MAHERMFDDDDRWLAVVRRLALALPDAREKISHGIPAFYTTKVFAYYGGSLKVDGSWVRHGQSVQLRPDPEDHRALVQDSRFYVPAYTGPSGWLGLLLDDRTDRDELTELLEDSYRQTAGVRRIARLDAGERAP